MISAWLPGKFAPKPASDAERLWTTFCPPGWEVFPFFGWLSPGLLLEYFLFRGHLIAGALGLLLWTPLLWLVLVGMHQEGRLRIWLSAPIFLGVHVAAALGFAGATL